MRPTNETVAAGMIHLKTNQGMLINVHFLLKKSQLPFGVLEKYSTFGNEQKLSKAFIDFDTD